MARYFVTIIETYQLVIQSISIGRAIFILYKGQPLKILMAFYENFFAGCGPERINPDDKKHRLPSVTKVISGSLPEGANT